MRTLTALLILLLLFPANIAKDSPITPLKAPAKVKAIHTVATVSRGAERVYLGEFEATAYCLNKQPTKLGIWPRKGVVAVDESIIPLGTRLYVEGYGEAVAADIGPAIRGRELDLWMNGYEACVRHGRKKLKVWRE